jgi:hypothetical protein
VRFIGLDVHLDFCEIAICEAGKVRSAGRVPSSPEGAQILANSLGPQDHVALEATGSALAIARLLEPRAGGRPVPDQRSDCGGPMPDTQTVLDAIVGVGGLLIGLAGLYLQARNRPAVSAVDQSSRDFGFRPTIRAVEDGVPEPDVYVRDSGAERDQPGDWIERQQLRAKRESDEWHAKFERESDEWRTRLASSFALLAAACLAIGCVAYILAAGTDSRLQSPGALAWGAAALGLTAAALGGMGFLQWGLVGHRQRGAPVALLVVVAGGLLVIFALRLLS